MQPIADIERSAPAGIGLRAPHHRELLATRPALGFVEVHSENFFAEGGAAIAALRDARECYAVSLHGVGLSLGSAAGIDPWHLDRLAKLVDRIEPVRVSDHASFARVETRSAAKPDAAAIHLNDLLPIARTEASLAILARNVDRVQERLRRTILVENLSAYVGWADDVIAEPEFFNALARRTGCDVLLDVNNLVVNALNAGDDPVASACAWIDALDDGIVGEMHLAGYAELDDIVIDDHGSRVHVPVWKAYQHAIKRFGSAPTLIEWDTDLPSLAVLLEEAAMANALQARIQLSPRGLS